MDFKQIEAFVQVINLGSFSKAADKLFLTQPTISAHISSLERELDTQLVIRTPKEAYASETGKLLYEYALDMISLRDKAVAVCKNQQTNMCGSINIAASTIPYQHVLPRVMSQFRQQYPDVKFNVLSCDSGEVVSNILSGKAEIGMTGARMDSSKCVYQDFMDDDLVVITPNMGQYAGRDANAFRLADLVQYPFITREPGSGTRKETEAHLVKKGLDPTTLNIAAQLDNPDAIKNSVSQGLGISIVSQLSSADYEAFGLVRVFRLEGESMARKLYLVHHKNRPLSPIASVFARYVSDFYRGQQKINVSEAG